MAPIQPATDRRSANRRHNDRRYAARRGDDATGAALADESLFDALGVD